MSVLIVYCHPYEHSFNHAVLESIQHNLAVNATPFKVIDLYQDHFVPFYSKDELALYHQGKTLDPLVEQYLAQIQTAQTVIFITPVWWNSIPGILKGFVDKVMKEGPGLSHIVTKTGIRGLLTNIRHCYVLTTSTSPTWYLRFLCGNAIQKIFINKTSRQLGFHGGKWINFGGISNSSKTQREKFLNRIMQYHFD